MRKTTSRPPNCYFRMSVFKQTVEHIGNGMIQGGDRDMKGASQTDHGVLPFVEVAAGQQRKHGGRSTKGLN